MKNGMRQEILTWSDVDHLLDILLPQFHGHFDGMLMITRGGIVPGGMIAEALGIKHIFTAAVNFPHDVERAKLLAWPEFLQFPDDSLLVDKRILIVDDVWGSGRTITAVKGRVEAAGGYPELCVFHYNPKRSLFPRISPIYYAAITDAWITYPWEIDRGGPDKVLSRLPVTN